MVAEPLWLTTDEVVAIHDDQIDRYDGLAGVNDLGLVDSAVHAPRQTFHYEGEQDVLVLGLILCRAIAKNHGFLDGNKRAATAAMLLFLELNGYELIVPDDDPEEPWLAKQVESMVITYSMLPTVYAALIPYLHELP